MAIQPALFQGRLSKVRKGWVEVSRLYDDGFLYLKGDPHFWIESNPDSVSSVRSLELDLMGYEGERIGDSIGELSQLTHLVIFRGSDLKCLPDTLSRLHNLHHLEFHNCGKLEEIHLHYLKSLSFNYCNLKSVPNSVAKLPKLATLFISECNELEELPENLGDLHNLTSLSLEKCYNLNHVPKSVAKLSNLTTLFISNCRKLEELPANLGDLKLLASLFLYDCNRFKYLPWSITKLSKLRIIYLPEQFRLETLPPHLNVSIIITVDKTHIRKTWKELKIHITETLSFQFPIIREELPQKTSTPGYLQFTGNLTPWIQDDLLSSLRILDLDIGDWIDKGDLLDSIGELSELTHLYITNGCLPRHLPPTFTRITHLSLINYTFECDTVSSFEFDTKSYFDSLGKLSTLTSLHLRPEEGFEEFCQEDIDPPISLRHLSLSYFESITDSYVASMAKLSNLNTLILSFCGILKSLLLNLNVNKLILRETLINSLPIGLKHLEVVHDSSLRYTEESCNKYQECLNQLVNLDSHTHVMELNPFQA